MADPFSIVSGVAGIISLGLTVCNEIHAYFSAIKGRNDEIEVVSQQLTLLRSNIEIIESISSKLSTRHALATTGIAQGLKDCERHFKALQTFLKELTTANISSSKQKWQNRKLIMMYPFNQKKLVQMHERLSKAQDTLENFVQSLILDVNVGVGDDLRAFRADMKASDCITHEYLNKTTSQLHTIAPAVEHTSTQLTRVSARVEEHITQATSSHALLHAVNSRLLQQSTQMETIISFVEQVCQNSRAQGSILAELETTPRYMKNAEAERRLYRDLAKMRCTCTNSKPTTVDRKSSHVYRAWASLAILKQVHVQNVHQPGCAFHDSKFSTTSTNTTLSYTGLSFLLRRALNLSLTQTSVESPYSMSFTLRPCRVVASSPAFRLVSCRPSINEIARGRQDRIERVVKRLMRELPDLYSSGKASPFDVDQKGRNIGQCCVEEVLGDFIPGILNGAEGDALSTLFSYLSCLGVPINTADFSQRTILDSLVDIDPASIVLPKFYDTIVRCFPGFDPTVSLVARRPLVWWVTGPHTWPVLNVYRERLDILEAFGVNDLFLAIMQKNEPKLETILTIPQFFNQITQTDRNGRNVLHMSSDWVTGLRLLLKHKATHSLLNNRASPFCLTPLDFSLLYSGFECTARDQWMSCSDCTCYVPAKLLLEADCSVTANILQSDVLSNCSMKARALFFEHFKDRRKRLRNIALASLSPDTLHRYGVNADILPDTTAMTLYEELREKGYELNPGLSPNAGMYPGGFASIFTYPLHLKVAELALSLGIKPFNDCRIPLIRLSSGRSPDNLEEALVYADWLIRNGVQIDLCTGSFKLSAAHHFAGVAGYWVRQYYASHEEMPQLQQPKFKRVLLAISHSQAESRLPCPYMTKPLNRPLAHLLFMSVNDIWYYDRKRSRIRSMSTSVELIQGVIDNQEAAYLTRCALLILTLLFLGVRRLFKCDISGNDAMEEHASDPSYQEQWAEILEEDQPLIEQANTLTNDFEEVFQRQNVSLEEFLLGHWLPRMRQVRRSNAQFFTDSQKDAMRDIGVVLDETGGSISDSDSLDSWDSWDDEEWNGNDEGRDEFEQNSFGSGYGTY